MKQRRTVFFVSDQTGVTAETMGHSLLTQFDGLDFRPITLPFITTIDKAREAVSKIDQAARDEGVRPVVFATFVNNNVRDAVRRADCVFLDFFAAFLEPLEQEFGQPSAHVLGRAHGMTDLPAYTLRINATNFALANDDGAQTRDYDRADVILLGVSRSGKTPTCVYMALQYATYAANYPLTDEDLDGSRLPAAVEPFRNKLFGLTIQPRPTRSNHWWPPPSADPPGTATRQPLCLAAAVRIRGARRRAAFPATRCSISRNDRLFDRGDREPRARAPVDPPARASVMRIVTNSTIRPGKWPISV